MSRQAPKCCLRLAASRGGPRNALGYRPEPEVLPLPAETSREAAKCCIKGGGPETRSGTVQSLKCCPCQQKRAARLPSAAPWQHQGGGGPNQVLCLAASREGGARNALGYCPEPPCQQKPAARLPSAAPGSIKSAAPKRARAPSRA